MNRAIYEKRIIAFVDILGFKTMIDDSKADTLLRRKIKEVMEIIRESADTSIKSSVRKVSTFSDSAVISYPLTHASALLYLLLDIIHLQLKVGALGVMIRGGIAIGDCYHDGKIVFGPAMIEAYRLENTVAKWPRVVITAEALNTGIQETVKHNQFSREKDVATVMDCLKQDDYNEEINNPNLYFVDFLRQPQELIEFGDEYYEWLRNFRVAIVEGLNRYSPANEALESSPKEAETVFSKYRWIMKYWNSVVSDKKANMPVPNIDQEDQESFRDLYRTLSINMRYPYR